MRPITERDWPLFLGLHTDPKVIALCFDEPPMKEIKNKFAARLQSWHPGSESWLCWVISDRASGNDIGVTGLVMNRGIAEVGYLLLPQFHGQGYATESLAALLDWAFNEHDIAQYRAAVTQGNAGSESVLRKCDFELLAIEPDAYTIGGKWYDDYVYVLDKKLI
ncbi:GNAT family N-acetyltransferase [Aestuariirhabdus sp. Z084]|nr:GNAT family N-acetyltransferase [Aestuariirhabdus haliotis]MCL6415396.1 GNAT family N-acetyltransferase [Aestuariirhabdus haliotis]MCL6419152.1 GNAT family N-acetyltransferase [Aestuariirhabdus haliotis]